MALEILECGDLTIGVTTTTHSLVGITAGMVVGMHGMADGVDGMQGMADGMAGIAGMADGEYGIIGDFAILT